MSEPTIVDDGELRRWFAEGRPYLFMVDAYERQYGLQVAPSLLGKYRRRHGLIHGRSEQWVEDAGIKI